MKTIALFVMLALASCSKDKGDQAQPAPSDKPAEPATATVSCASSIGKAYDRLPSDAPQAKTMVSKLKEVMIKLCTDDKWPTAVLQCYEAAKAQPDMKACRDGLPPEMKAKAGATLVQVMNELRGEMMGGGGGGSGPDPHGTGSATPK